LFSQRRTLTQTDSFPGVFSSQSLPPWIKGKTSRDARWRRRQLRPLLHLVPILPPQQPRPYLDRAPPCNISGHSRPPSQTLLSPRRPAHPPLNPPCPTYTRLHQILPSAYAVRQFAYEDLHTSRAWTILNLHPIQFQRQRPCQNPTAHGKPVEDVAALNRAHPHKPCSPTIV
jgi:hypothetical protein